MLHSLSFPLFVPALPDSCNVCLTILVLSNKFDLVDKLQSTMKNLTVLTSLVKHRAWVYTALSWHCQ